MDCSVIICTHDPRPDYLRRVLNALKAQTLPTENWELLVIDNASRETLADVWNLSWHPRGRIVREDEMGLTPARLRGIRESAGELLIFVDDDNVLARDYLANATRLAAEWPMLGAFGGSISGEFESHPPDWITPYLAGLAIRELDRDYWSSLGGISAALPCGAGLCVRRLVAKQYLQQANANDLRRQLDRSGASLGAGGDSDLAECAPDIGLGTGCFKALKLVHLIPARRLTADYIVRLYAGFAASSEILARLRSRPGLTPPSGLEGEIRFLLNVLTATGIRRKILLASHRARKQVRRLISRAPGSAWPTSQPNQVSALSR